MNRRVPQALPNVPQQFQIDISGRTPHACDCGCNTFRPAIQLYVISAIISPNGQEIIAQNQVFECCKCHAAFVKP